MASGFRTRYSLTSDRARSKVTGNEGAIIAGWSLGLPDQAHKLVLSSSAAQLLKQKEFFLPYERHIASDKLLADLRFSKRIGVMPLYFDSLPNSDEVTVVTSVTVHLPIPPSSDMEKLATPLRHIKRKLTELLAATKESVLSLANNLLHEIEELTDSIPCFNSIQVQIFCLEFSTGMKKE